MFIGLAGKSGSGKNVIADHFANKWNFVQIAVADAIRQELWEYLQDAWQVPESFPRSFVTVLRAYQTSIWAKPTSPEMRVFLQWWGDYRRDIDHLYWVKKLEERIRTFHTEQFLVISDLRLPDECDLIERLGGEVWNVVRKCHNETNTESVGIHDHKTEIGLSDYHFKRYVLNDSSVQDLLKKVDEKLFLSV